MVTMDAQALAPELEARLKRCRELPSPPAVAERILDIAQDAGADLARLADAISVDPATTAKILRTANSPLYSRQRKSANLRQALSLLGLNASISLALSFSLARAVQPERGGGLDVTHLWRRSLLAAVCTRELGRAVGRADGEELFLAGLLQFIGVLALDRLDPGLYAGMALAAQTSEGLAAHERPRLGSDHARVGGWLLANWGLPEPLCDAVAARLQAKSEVEGGETDAFTRCVAYGAATAEIWLAPEPPDDALERLIRGLHVMLELDDAGVRDLLEMMRRRIPETESVFETQLIAPPDADLLLEQARELMMVRNLQALEETRMLRDTAEVLRSRAAELEERGRRDSLTDLFNRARLDELLHAELRTAGEQGWPVSVLFIDIDHFKSVNDSHGHATGDEVLRRAAQLLKACTREADIVGRYGGEEFVVLLPGNGANEASVVAERILRAFRRARHVSKEGREFGITVSIGGATHETGSGAYRSMHELMDAADRALYAAKYQGRDQLVVAHPTTSG
jgi:diguanylate cyclase (GGDEF)-like protein